LKNAKEAFEDLHRIQPNHHSANYFLGTIALQEQRLEEAKEHLKRSINTLPTAEAHTNLAIVYLQTNEIQEALHNSEKALKINPAFVSLNIFFIELNFHDQQVD
jgi:tetratricopeptide (TPR) repeat protein